MQLLKNVFRVDSILLYQFRHYRFLSTSGDSIESLSLAYTDYSSNTSAEDSDPNVYPPIFIAHGMFGQRQNWNSIAKNMQRRVKNKVIAFDLRNHGDSPHSERMSYPECTADLLRLISHFNSNPSGQSILIGHSLGGKVVAHCALSKPALVNKLVICDVAPRAYVRSTRRWVVQYIEAMKSIDFPPGLSISDARKFADKQLSHQIQETAIRQFLVLNLSDKVGTIGWKCNLDVLLRTIDRMALFEHGDNAVYNGPTLLLKGELSDYIREEDEPIIKRLFPNASVKVVEGAGHWLHAEQPEKFLSLLMQFLQK